MNNIKSYLKNKNMTLYQLAKDSNVSYPTVFNIVNGKSDINNCAYGILNKLATTLLLTVDEFVNLCRTVDMFYVFRSEQQHLVKRKGELQYIIDTLTEGTIRALWNRDKTKQALYVLAMVDYLSRRNSLPKCNDYNDIRNYKLKNLSYPVDVEVESLLMQDDQKNKLLQQAIPEFLEFNIVEMEFL